MALDVHQFAELTAFDDALEFEDRRPEPPVVPHAEDDAGGLAGGNHFARVGGIQGQRLFAEHVLARFRTCDYLFGVQRMRRGQYHCVNRRVS